MVACDSLQLVDVQGEVAIKFDLFAQTVGVGHMNSSPFRRQIINLTNFRLLRFQTEHGGSDLSGMVRTCRIERRHFLEGYIGHSAILGCAAHTEHSATVYASEVQYRSAADRLPCFPL